ncbi:MAG: DegT/DnrJ/EryC1/StrS family aminotransferase [Actinomycetota bacterium]
MSPPAEPSRVVPLSQPTFGEEEIEALRSVLDSGWVAGQGPRGRELEDRFAAWCGDGHVVAVANCTAALHLAMLGFDVGPGDEVIVADYTYPATGHAVRYTGATPCFVDVRPDTWTIDVDAAAAAVSERTVGIVAVDTLGQCADFAPLRKLAQRSGLFLVEDAACSVGATYRGEPSGSGTLSDVACFSLHARKGITSGEGGLLATSDPDRADRARRLSCFGVESAHARQASGSLPIPVFEELGYNYKLSDIQAAVALVQLGRLPELLRARRRVAAAYGELLGDLPGVTLPVVGEDREHTWQTFALTLDPSLPRNEIATRLRAFGVQSNIGTFASHVQPVYGPQPPCPVSRGLFDRHVAIPMHANLTDSDVEYVASVVRDVVLAEAA